MKHILILGGDGYLGWPTAMYFSKRGFAVTLVDNYFRRQESVRLNTGMLFPVPNLVQRAQIWYEITGLEIKVVIDDLADTDAVRKHFDGRVKYNWAVNYLYSGIPQTVIHYAEQPSAPFSMIDYKHADTTITNNLRVTNNIMWAVRDFSRDTHIIKLGTMGEYGTPNIDIEEGWLEIHHKGRKDKFLFPRQASSIYHTTKIMDTDLLWFGVRTWNLRVTDLMQGPVYGIQTDESMLDERLMTMFNYDEVFGTIINRFVTQAVIGYPLTVYGSGGQTRGYINIKDTVQCLFKTALNPPKEKELRIYNQITETFSANQLAEMVSDVGRQRGHSVQIRSISNPRKEAEEHYYNPTYQGLQGIGVVPNLLTKEVIHGFFEIVERFKQNIRKDVISIGIKW